MENILRKKHYKLTFYVLVGLILLLAIVVRTFVLPQFDMNLQENFPHFAAAFLDGLVISLIITVSIGSFVFWLTPEIVKKSVMEVIEPKEIGLLLKKAAIDSRTWVYKGACGRYTKSTTLPGLAKAARQEGLGRDIRITLLNPAKDDLCDVYATYRKSLKSAGKDDLWTKNRVKEEVIATVVSALRFKHDEPLLRINIFLANHFSTFRLDISDHYVIVTKEDKEAAGLRADVGTYFYNSYIDDVRLCERQSIEVEYIGEIPNGQHLTRESLKSIISKTAILSEEQFDELDVENIIKLVNSPTDPYS